MKETKRTTHVIPALPGHHTVNYELFEGVLHIYTSPVIAWQVTVTERQGSDDFTWATPIPADNCAFAALLHPNGQLDRNEAYHGLDSWSGGDIFSSLDEFKAAVLKHLLSESARPENPPAI